MLLNSSTSTRDDQEELVPLRSVTSAVVVWDIETIPDLEAARRMLELPEQPEQQIREAMGGFPKHPLHKIACIGALIAKRINGTWQVTTLGAPHIGERSEASIINGFVSMIAKLRPQLVTFNGSSFDLPVLRYRAMMNEISAPGLFTRNYFYRYSEDALDLCDALSSFDGRSKVKLAEFCRILSLGGKLNGMDGSKVEAAVAAGRISEVAAYCETDVIITYGIWLHYQLFRGTLTREEFLASKEALRTYLTANKEKKPHFSTMVH